MTGRAGQPAPVGSSSSDGGELSAICNSSLALAKASALGGFNFLPRPDLRDFVPANGSSAGTWGSTAGAQSAAGACFARLSVLDVAMMLPDQ